MRAGMIGITSKFWPIAIARGLKAVQDVELIAAATLGSGRGNVREHLGMTPEEYAAEFDVKLYVDAREMIAEEKLDTVVLNVRHSEHAGWAERLAKLKLDIYIPKPFATTLSDARRIVEAGEKYDVNIACGPSDRYQPAILAAKTALDGGRIGEPFAMRMAHHHGTIEGFHNNDWYREAKEGGPEFSLGWYVIDLAIHLMGAGVARVFADYQNYTSPESPFMDCGKMLLRMDTGAMVSCDMYFCNRVPYPVWELEILGPSGVLKVHAEGGTQKLLTTLYTAQGIQNLPLPQEAPNREVAWVEGFRGKAPAVVPAETALEITRVSLAARDSALKGRVIAMDESTDQAK